MAKTVGTRPTDDAISDSLAPAPAGQVFSHHRRTPRLMIACFVFMGF
jgi:hypothetical protein